MLVRIAPAIRVGVKSASCAPMAALHSCLASSYLCSASSHLERHKSSSACRSILGDPEFYQSDEEKGPPGPAKTNPHGRFRLRRASLTSLPRRKRRESDFSG